MKATRQNRSNDNTTSNAGPTLPLRTLDATDLAAVRGGGETLSLNFEKVKSRR